MAAKRKTEMRPGFDLEHELPSAENDVAGSAGEADSEVGNAAH